jgi:hypothetical protein
MLSQHTKLFVDASLCHGEGVSGGSDSSDEVPVVAWWCSGDAGMLPLRDPN